MIAFYMVNHTIGPVHGFAVVEDIITPAKICRQFKGMCLAGSKCNEVCNCQKHEKQNRCNRNHGLANNLDRTIAQCCSFHELTGSHFRLVQLESHDGSIYMTRWCRDLQIS